MKMLDNSRPTCYHIQESKTRNTVTESSSRREDPPREPRAVESGRCLAL